MAKYKTKADKEDMNGSTAPVTVEISLPPYQVKLLEDVKILLEQVIASGTDNYYLTEPQAAKTIGVSAGVLYRWRKAGYLRYRQFGGNVRYNIKELFEDFDLVAAIPSIYKPSRTKLDIIARKVEENKKIKP